MQLNCVQALTATQAFEPTAVEIGLVGYPVEGDLAFTQFAQKLTAHVQEAAHAGLQMVVFPELLVQELVNHSLGEDSFGEQVLDLSRHWDEFLALQLRLSKQFNIIVFSGTFPRRAGDKVYNTGAIIFPNGEYFLQDKLFMTPFEIEWGISPGESLTVIETIWGNWIHLICYDCEIPFLSNLIADVRPTLILTPSMTEALPGFHRVRWTAQGRAIEHKTFVAHVGMVGGPSSWPNYGQCSVIGPYDSVLCGLVAESQPNFTGVFPVRLDFQRLQMSRLSNSVYPARDQQGVVSGESNLRDGLHDRQLKDEDNP